MSRSMTFFVALVAMLCFCTTTILAETTAPQCGNPPTLIPDTFSVSYQPNTIDTGIVFFTYHEPAWENWPMFDIRELASDPFSATFDISLDDTLLDFETKNCYFQNPQTYTRATPVVANITNKILKMTFYQSGTYACSSTTKARNKRGRQQYSVTGSMNLKIYSCTAGQPTAGATPRVIDAASKVSLPDIFVHEPCSRLTLSYDSTSQLTLRQTNGVALDISGSPFMDSTNTAAPKTVLLSYTIKQVPGVKHQGNPVYNNILSYCTFNGNLNSTFTPAALFLPGTDPSQITFNIKNSKIPSYCLNGERDFDESDVDCGGNGQLNGCPQCVDESQICNGNSDCASSSCQNHQIAGKRCASINGSNTSAFAFALLVALVVAVCL